MAATTTKVTATTAAYQLVAEDKEVVRLFLDSGAAALRDSRDVERVRVHIGASLPSAGTDDWFPLIAGEPLELRGLAPNDNVYVRADLGQNTVRVLSWVAATNFGDVTSEDITFTHKITANVGVYEDEGSYQPFEGDLALGADAGRDDDEHSYLGPFMGHVFGDDPLTKTGNTLFGVIGKYNLPGAVASNYPVGGVIGEIGEECTDTVTPPDGAVVAVIGGDSGAVRARALFAARHLNSTAGSGVDYGIDLMDPKADGLGYNAIVPDKALLRGAGDFCIIMTADAPVDYTDGTPPATGEGYAGIGSIVIRQDTGKMYVNGGTKAEPLWKLVTSA